MAIIIPVIIFCVAVGIGSNFWLGSDNLVEESMEEIIEDQTGADVDLTPETKED